VSSRSRHPLFWWCSGKDELLAFAHHFVQEPRFGGLARVLTFRDGPSSTFSLHPETNIATERLKWSLPLTPMVSHSDGFSLRWFPTSMVSHFDGLQLNFIGNLPPGALTYASLMRTPDYLHQYHPYVRSTSA
jgi:hypothetical protein